MRAKPKPTKRAMVDVGRKCNINCRFCYYEHLGDLRTQKFDPLQKLKDEVMFAKSRGNTYIDFTGGEPTIFPEMAELVKFTNENGMKCCIITNGLCGDNTTMKLINAGVDDWLISNHGIETVHNYLTKVPNSKNKQLDFIALLKGYNQSFRFNTVINKFNQETLVQHAEEMASLHPRIVNFINFNPHGDWSKNPESIRGVIANLRKVEPFLNVAIDTLEKAGIGVNVRYYPMCRIRKDLRRCVCNDLHVMFDPYEWDYKQLPKTLEAYGKWGIETSNMIEWKGFPCKACGIKHTCGGINGAYNCATKGEYIEAVEDKDIENKYFYAYRQDNILTLQERN